MPAVKFYADIEQDGALISGTITERNTFDLHAGDILTAALDGHLSGNIVSFEKTYLNSVAQYAIMYSGSVSKDANLITGKWDIGEWNGNFEMKRATEQQKISILRKTRIKEKV